MKLDILKKHKYNNYSGLPFEMQVQDFSIKQVEKRKQIDAIRNRISDFDKWRISQPKTQ